MPQTQALPRPRTTPQNGHNRSTPNSKLKTKNSTLPQSGDALHPVARLFLIYQMLSMGSPIKREDLAAACGCATKTVGRDLERLESLGARCPWDARQRSYVLTQPLRGLKVELELPEVAALALLGQAAFQQAGLPQAATARSALHKLTARLPASLRAELSAAGGVINVESALRRDYTQAPLPELVSAARQHRTARMLYYSISRDALDWRLVDPYSLALQGGYLNLVAYCHEHREVRLFALDAVRDVTLTPSRFVAPAGFSLTQFLAGAVHMLRGQPESIEVRFAPAIARWAQGYKWGFVHTLTAQADGSLVLSGTVSGLLGIRNELLRWGAGAEVLAPPALRQMMQQEAAAMLATYAAAPEK